MENGFASTSYFHNGELDHQDYQPQTFHWYHGANITLHDENTVALRRTSFADGIAFSSRPVESGEIFLIRIEEVESGWTGQIRLGLTTLNPNSRPRLPTNSLPDFQVSGLGWVYAVSKDLKSIYNGISQEIPINGAPRYQAPEPIDGQDALSHRLRARAPHWISQNCLPDDKGSYIGLYYVESPHDARVADMHFLVNGIDMGPVASDLPLERRPFYAVIDVYGTTKQIRIIPVIQRVASLQHLCRTVILRGLPSRRVDVLPLPPYLKDFLLSSSLCCHFEYS